MSFPAVNSFSRALSHLLFLSLVPAVLLLLVYQALFTRPFIADDYQWLVLVRDLTLGKLLWLAFDPTAQTHFYRPLIWLLLWLQDQLFGLDPFGFHTVSLVLHLLNALLAGALAVRLRDTHAYHHWVRLVAVLIVVLHPAPFEAVTWISAQSELLAATLLLGMCVCWVDRRPRLAVLLLVGALLAKESAVIGFGLLVVLKPDPLRRRDLGLPFLISLAYLVMQALILGQNTVVRGAAYGIGLQLLENPLRSLALVVVPLPGTEHADAGWLVPVGGVLLLVLLGAAARMRNDAVLRWLAVLLLVLLPTAPFTSPPDSRYLYLAVLVAAIGISQLVASMFAYTSGLSRIVDRVTRVTLVLVFCAAMIYSAGELAAREARFAAAGGPGGSLWQLATRICRDVTPRHMFLVDPPLAGVHAAAIVELACGPDVDLRIVTRTELNARLVPESVVIGFPGGSASVERWV